MSDQCPECEDQFPRWMDRLLLWLLVTPTAFDPRPFYRWAGIVGSGIWLALTISGFRAWRKAKRRRPSSAVPAPLPRRAS